MQILFYLCKGVIKFIHMRNESLLDLDSYVKSLKLGASSSKYSKELKPPFQETPPTTRRSFIQQTSTLHPPSHKLQYPSSTLQTTPKQSQSRSQSINPNETSSPSTFSRPTSKYRLSSHLVPHPTSRHYQQTFLSTMLQLLQKQHQTLTQRILQMRQKVKQHIQSQFQTFRATVLKFVDDLFQESKDVFVLTFEKKATEVNACYFVIEEQLKEISQKLKEDIGRLSVEGVGDGLEKEEEGRIGEQVQGLVASGERLQVRMPVVKLDKQKLGEVEEYFRQLVLPRLD